jgi:hypothetical protein
MYLENGRDLFPRVLIIIFTAVSYRSDLKTGPLLTGFVGLLILQSAFTNWCLADWLLRPMGLRDKLERGRDSGS